MTPVLEFEVSAEAHGTRLDKWLADTVPDLSRARAQSLIAGGAITVQSKPATDSARKVKAGEHVAVTVPAPKPAGLVVHPAAGNADRTLVNALLAHCGESLLGIGGVLRPGIVHRLDKDTSGLIVAAKTETAHAALAAQFATHAIERRYDALVWGVPKPPRGNIVGAIGRSPHNRQKMAIVKRGGKPAETGYTTIASFGGIAAHLQCQLKTGRTHQIRVHMAFRGHPLIGDPVYGRNRKLPKDVDTAAADAISDFCRQALHAATLGFSHPDTGRQMRFERPPPEDFARLEMALRRL
jgi:23S rRNA pseudouridine1911/1915/1917 synthase